MFNQQAYGMGAAPNQIRQIFEYGRQQAKLLGEDKVYDFSLGNPSIPAPASVNESIHRLLDTESSIRIHGYTSGVGGDPLREAVARNLSERFGVKAYARNVFISCGAAPALESVLVALRMGAQTEIIGVAPYFMEYKAFTEAAGMKFVLVPADLEKFQVNIPALDEAISENTQGVILNSPNNPSGAVLTEETLKAVAKLLTEKSEQYGHPIYLIADEPYRELTYDAVVPFIPTIYRDTIVCYSWSKSLSMPGERIGYVYVPEEATDSRELFLAVAGAARASGHICAPSLIQRAVAENIGCMPDLEAYKVNRKLLYEGLTEIGYECVKPDGAFYLFVKTPGGDNSVFCEKAKAKNLLVVPSEPFGVEGYFRLGYCVSKEMIERALPVFKEVFDEMK